MIVKDKKILILGLGITGISSLKALCHMGVDIYVFDDMPYDEILDKTKNLNNFTFNIIKEIDKFDFSILDYVLKSPGIKPDNHIVLEAERKNVRVVTDIELAYQIYGGDKLIAITGTNGKTTTTSLVSHILNSMNIKNKVVGNIGIGILWEMYNDNSDFYVVEMSSFQLKYIYDFKPRVACITNITPDHIDWHGSYEDYKNCKYNIYKNLMNKEKLILNFDDENLKNLEIKNIDPIYFSTHENSEKVKFIYKEAALFKNEKFIIKREDISLVGNHNVSNVLCAIAILDSLGFDFDKIVSGIKTFEAIEHRIEPVKEINGVWYYNDSKGTNVDSTKKAIYGFDSNIILIAGGYDKKSKYDEMFLNPEKIKYLLLLGQTKDEIEKTAIKYGVENIVKFNDLEQAVLYSKNISKKGDVVLFSPACASWDMYKNFEERGRHFKKIVNEL